MMFFKENRQIQARMFSCFKFKKAETQVYPFEQIRDPYIEYCFNFKGEYLTLCKKFESVSDVYSLEDEIVIFLRKNNHLLICLQDDIKKLGKDDLRLEIYMQFHEQLSNVLPTIKRFINATGGMRLLYNVMRRL